MRETIDIFINITQLSPYMAENKNKQDELYDLMVMIEAHTHAHQSQVATTAVLHVVAHLALTFPPKAMFSLQRSRHCTLGKGALKPPT